MPGNTAPTRNSRRSQLKLMIVLLIVCVGLFTFWFRTGSMTSTKVNIYYSQFIAMIKSGTVQIVYVSDLELRVTIKADADLDIIRSIVDSDGSREKQISRGTQITYVTGRIDDPTLADMLMSNDVEFVMYTSAYRSMAVMMLIVALTGLLPTIFLFTRTARRPPGEEDNTRRGRDSRVGRTTARAYSPEDNTGVFFEDVAGQDEAKESLTEIIDFLHNPEKYTKIGAKQPKGALLVGPPGTGKTLLAKAVAGEAGVPFFHQNGSEFVELYVGVGASRVRDLFKNAEKDAPCIIFIDEIDAIGKRRENSPGGNDEREQTLNQLLSEMDGFDTSKGIVILAATNRPEILDIALLRPGRFDRRIIVERPDIKGRIAILKVHAANVPLGDDVDLTAIAQTTSGATGADLSNMVNEAALRAVKMGREFVMQEDLMEAVEVVTAGKEKKDRILTPKEKELIAFHEVGHALTSALQDDANTVKKITIVPRTMGSLGYTLNVPEEERYIYTRRELRSRIITLLGGRAAELLEFDDCTTGASNDIERATDIARDMITRYGMSEKFGPVGMERQGSQYLEGRNVSNYSEETGGLIDAEVRKIIDECQQAAVDMLTEHRAALTAISQYLVEKENLTGDEFMELLKEYEVA